MNKLQSIFDYLNIFKNPERKLKKIAVWFFVIFGFLGMLGSYLTGLEMGQINASAIYGVFTLFVVYVVSLLIYSFGDLLENIKNKEKEWQ